MCKQICKLHPWLFLVGRNYLPTGMVGVGESCGGKMGTTVPELQYVKKRKKDLFMYLKVSLSLYSIYR